MSSDLVLVCRIILPKGNSKPISLFAALQFPGVTIPASSESNDPYDMYSAVELGLRRKKLCNRITVSKIRDASSLTIAEVSSARGRLTRLRRMHFQLPCGLYEVCS